MKFARAFFRLFTFMKPLRGKYFAATVLASSELVMLFSVPIVNRMLVVMITEGGGADTMQQILLIMAGLLALTPLVAVGVHWHNLCVQKTADNIKEALFAHIQRLPLGSIAKRQTGDYLMRVTNDADWAVGILRTYHIMNLARFIVVTSVVTVLLVLADWRIALLSFGYSLISFTISLRANPTVNKLDREARQEIAASSNVVLETMRSLPIVRVFVLGHMLAERYRLRCTTAMQKRAKFRAVNGAVYGIVDFFTFSAQAVGFIAAVFLLMRGEMALSDAVYTASLMALAADAMLRLSTFILWGQPPLVAAGRVFEILDDPGEMTRESVTQADVHKNEAVVLENVSFAYPDGTAALQDINLTIKRGEQVALVGGSGGGKTTLAQIIASLYEPSTGKISFYGADSQDLSLQDLRSLIAYVPQEPILFDGSLYENIALGKLGATLDEVKKAAKDAGLGEFIESLPEGYDTQVGERGAQVSGGQRQRVAIARAILKDAPLLILDEATSALDSDTEAQVQQSLDSLISSTGNRCTITVAHRLSTIRNADRILVMEKGCIVEEGTYSSLTAQTGKYTT